MNANQFLTAQDVADRFQVSVRVVYAWIDRGLLSAQHIGPRLIRFTEEDIDEFLRRSSPEAS